MPITKQNYVQLCKIAIRSIQFILYYQSYSIAHSLSQISNFFFFFLQGCVLSCKCLKFSLFNVPHSFITGFLKYVFYSAYTT